MNIIINKTHGSNAGGGVAAGAVEVDSGGGV